MSTISVSNDFRLLTEPLQSYWGRQYYFSFLVRCICCTYIRLQVAGFEDVHSAKTISGNRGADERELRRLAGQLFSCIPFVAESHILDVHRHSVPHTILSNDCFKKFYLTNWQLFHAVVGEHLSKVFTRVRTSIVRYKSLVIWVCINAPSCATLKFQVSF
jgi:hypothetical protein